VSGDVRAEVAEAGAINPGLDLSVDATIDRRYGMAAEMTPKSAVVKIKVVVVVNIMLIDGNASGAAAAQ
jgi:hypothetical protein